jgi:hypothetical protein
VKTLSLRTIMKIYEITSRTPNEQLINEELKKLSEAISRFQPINESTTAPVSAASGFFSKSMSAVLKFLKGVSLFYLAKPFYKCYTNMQTAEENLKDDKSPDAEKRYNEELVIQVGLLVAGIASALLTMGVFKTATAFLGFIRYVPFVGPIIANIINLLSASAQVYVLSELSSVEGRNKLAKLLTGTILGNGVKGLGTGVVEAYKYIADVVNSALDEEAKTTATEKPADNSNEKPADKSAETPAAAASPSNNEPKTTDTPPEPVKKNPNALDWTKDDGQPKYW